MYRKAANYTFNTFRNTYIQQTKKNKNRIIKVGFAYFWNYKK